MTLYVQRCFNSTLLYIPQAPSVTGTLNGMGSGTAHILMLATTNFRPSVDMHTAVGLVRNSRTHYVHGTNAECTRPSKAVLQCEDSISRLTRLREEHANIITEDGRLQKKFGINIFITYKNGRNGLAKTGLISFTGRQ